VCHKVVPDAEVAAWLPEDARQAYRAMRGPLGYASNATLVLLGVGDPPHFDAVVRVEENAPVRLGVDPSRQLAEVRGLVFEDVDRDQVLEAVVLADWIGPKGAVTHNLVLELSEGQLASVTVDGLYHTAPDVPAVKALSR
jgi:hypothetical protein